eukprot:m.43282 g.43282  ORF g.43282 m.43282 type:complete len:71 (+) comp9962_c0_seq1:631-843(+)
MKGIHMLRRALYGSGIVLQTTSSKTPDLFSVRHSHPYQFASRTFPSQPLPGTMTARVSGGWWSPMWLQFK